MILVPNFQTIYHLSEGQLGLSLSGLAIGGFLIMPILGNLIKKFSSKATVAVGVIGWHISAPFVFAMPNAFIAWLFLIFWGIETSTFVISINAQGLVVGKKLKKSIISSVNGFYSIGSVIGAVIGGILISLKLNPFSHLALVSAAFLPFSILLIFFLIREESDDTETNNRKASVLTMLKSRIIWIFGIILFIEAVSEKMMRDWSTIYLLKFATNEQSIAALGYALFSFFMTVGRLIGDKIAEKFSINAMIRLFFSISIVGILIIVSTDILPIIFIGFAVFGIGLSILLPFVYQSVGDTLPVKEIGAGLATIALFLSFANVIEPILLGFIAEISNLKFSFMFVGLLLIIGLFLSSKLQTIVND